MTEYLNALNEAQHAAVTCQNGPVLVIAGAGSGKTRVLTSRAAYLLDHGVAPDQMMALTFTNKAAEEMRSRLAGLIPYDIYSMWVGTFHRICLRILRMDGDKIGIHHDFAIFDEVDQRALVRSIIRQKGYDDNDLTPAAVLTVIGGAKSKMLDPETYMEEAVSSRDELYGQLYAEYERQLSTNNALDFDDLLNRVVELFSLYRDVLNEYRAHFPYLLVDEYQDTNEAQYRFLRLLAGKSGNIFVVGDPDQSIYSFRGARLENILNFQRDYPQAQVYRLETNYRSTAEILSVANRLIEHNEQRLDKVLHSHEKTGSSPTLQILSDERGEARYIADRIDHLRGRYHYRDMAVFYRTHALSRVLEETLNQRRIPFKVYGGVKFYERAEIKDTIAYLRLLVNPDDNVSLMRVINVPRRGIGNVTIEALEDMSTERNCSMYQALGQSLDEKKWKTAAEKSLRSFYELIKTLREYAPTHTVAETTNEVWNVTGYRAALENAHTVESLGRLENLDEFLNATASFDQETLKLGEVRTLSDFLVNTALASDLDALDEDDYLTLMTIHMAKGLEFPVVFIMGLEEGLFPHSRAVMSGKESDIEEERRLCYVGVTRAMDELFLLRAYRRMMYGKTSNNRGSRFLDEMGLADRREQKPARASEPIQPEEYDVTLSLGDKVRHGKYGEGVIVSFDSINGRAKVAFPELGIKEFLLAYANLNKVE